MNTGRKVLVVLIVAGLALVLILAASGFFSGYGCNNFC